MKILFVVPSYKPAYIYGGPIVVVAILAEQLALLGNEVTVYTTTANGKDELDVTLNTETTVDGVKVVYFTRQTGDHTHMSFPLWSHLDKTVKLFDVVHIHSWWNILVIISAWVCKKNNKKFMLSPHGMLSDYILDTNNSFKKKAIHAIGGKRLLASSRLHVSTKLELQESRNVISDWVGDIIVNPVQLSKKKYVRKNNKIFTIGFLSRVDPKKGIDVLIKSLSKVNFDFKLQIAGDGPQEYIKSLVDLSIELGVDSKIEWVGWKSGEDKFSFLSQLDLFALTSHSENFAIVVIEALSVGTPVLVSKNVGLYDYVQTNDYGWVTSMDENEIAAQLDKLVLEKEKIAKINQLAPGLIEEEYNGANLAKKYVTMYENMINS